MKWLVSTSTMIAVAAANVIIPTYYQPLTGEMIEIGREHLHRAVSPPSSGWIIPEKVYGKMHAHTYIGSERREEFGGLNNL